MNKKNSIKVIILIGLLSYSSYKLGQGDTIIVQKTVEVINYDKCICVVCGASKSYDEVLYVVDQNFEQENKSNTNINR